MGGVVDDIGKAIGGAVHGVEQAVGGIGSAVNAVEGGIASVVGDVGKGLGLPAGISDALEDITKVGLPIAATIFTGGMGGLGILGEAGAFPDALSFLGDAGGPLGSILGGDLAPGLGSILGGVGGSDFPLGNLIGGFADQFGGGGGILGGLLEGGPGSILGNMFGGGAGGGFDLGKLLPGITNGAGSVLQSVLGALPQLGGLIGGGANPLGVLGNLPNLAQNFNPTDVLGGLKQGLTQLANMFPNVSNTLKDVLGQLGKLGQPGLDPGKLLQEIAGKLGQMPELQQPMMPFNPMDMLGIGGFANQFLQAMGQPQLPQSIMDQIGKTVQDAVQKAMQNVKPGDIPIATPPFAKFNPGIFDAIRDIGFNPPSSGPGAATGGGGDISGGGGLTGQDQLGNAFGKTMNSINDVQQELLNLNPKDPDFAKKQFELQNQLQNLNSMRELINKFAELQHKAVEDTIQSFRV